MSTQQAEAVDGLVGVRSAVARGFPFLLAFAALKLLIHLLVGEGYGYFRDEFYYLACSQHLDWGYVDQPPLSIFALWLGRRLLGESVMAIRFLPALAGAATVLLGGWMAREMGGGRLAQALCMVSIIVAPAYLGTNGYYSMNSFDLLLWAAAAALLIRITARTSAAPGKDLGLWVLLGVILGLGLLNKISVLWLGAGLFVGLLLTPQRRRFLGPGPWIAGALAGLIFLPHVLWQVFHDWPTLEFIANATGNKMRQIAPLEFLQEQLLRMNPATGLIWVPGLVFFLGLKKGRSYRLLGWIYVTVLVILVVNRASRPGYLGPAYTMLFAGGGIVWEDMLRRLRASWVAPAVFALLALAGGILAPFALPILPVPTYIRYAAALGIGPSTDERKELAELPQHYADMFGWDELVETLARVHRQLTPEEQAVAGIFVYNYGEAGAIDLLGRQHGLPRALSGHNNYWLWGPGGTTGEVMIIVGGSQEGHQRAFREATEVARTDCGYCMPYENDQPIFVCRGIRTPVGEIWPRLKHYD